MSYFYRCTLLVIVFSLASCSKKTFPLLNIDGKEYVSVASFGAKGNGKDDDRPAIQRALDSGKNIYFPNGIYNLKSKTEGVAFLMVKNANYPANILFDDKAWLKIDKNADASYFKPSVLCIKGTVQPISNINITGLKIDGNRLNHTMTNPGLLLYSDKYLVSDINIINSKMKDMGGGGYHIEADNVYMQDIETSNCGSHGIGINAGSYNRTGLVYDIEISNFTSLDDDAYGIDFSGPYDHDKPKETLLSYHFKGKVKNIKVLNSENGIKTAGNWDLEIDSMVIDGSQHNGFYLSKNAPVKVINAKNVSISNCKDNGLYLSGASLFRCENLSVSNATVLMQLDNTDVEITNAVFDGNYANIASLRMGNSNVTIDKFVLKNNKANDEYPIWLQGKKVVLTNGIFENLNGISPFIIRNVDEVVLENIKEERKIGSRIKSFSNGATIDMKKGKITVKNCSFMKDNIRNISNTKVDFKDEK